MSDLRRFSPSTARNRDPILEVLRRVVPPGARVLEIASGTGEHAVHFAAHLPGVIWQPSDPDDGARASVEAWRAHAGADGSDTILPVLALDVRAPWPELRADAIVCINMIHIAPFEACERLLDGAARVLAPHAPLVLYGPYKRHGAHTAESNVAFDQSLRGRDPTWGVRDLEGEVVPAAAARGFALDEVVPMPANNFTVVFRRT